MADSQAYAMTIQQLTGPRAVLRMTGRGLPHRPISFPVGQRGEGTYLPGSPDGTVQFLGAEWMDTELKGFWHDRYLRPYADDGRLVSTDGAVELNGAVLPTAMDIMFAFTNVCTQGQLIELRWHRIVRRGWVRKFIPSIHNPTDIEWALQCDWISNGEQPEVAQFYRSVDVGDVAAQWATSLQQLQAVQPTFAIDQQVLQAINNIVGDIASSVDTLQSTVATAVSRVQAVVSTARTLIGVFSGLMQEAQNLASMATSITLQAYNLKEDAVTEFSDQLAAATYQRALVDQAYAMMRNAARDQSAIATDVDGNLLAVYTASAGEDYRDVSRRFFGTVDNWQAIMAYNGGTTSGPLDAGLIVFVPNLQAANLQNTTGA